MRSVFFQVFPLFVAAVSVNAFVSRPTTGLSSPQASSTELAFGIPKFLVPKTDDEDNNVALTKKNTKKDSDDKSKIGLSGILQLITAGAGAPFLGEYQGVDEETGKFMFSLEANNLVDEKGQSKQTQMPYFENGWVDPEEQARADARKGKGFKFPWDN